MGKEIAGSGVEGTIEMLKTAYAGELSAFHYFWYVSQNIEGLGVLEQKFLKNEQMKNWDMPKKSPLG